MNSNLASKTCFVCKPGTPHLQHDEIAVYRKQVSQDWEVVEDNKIEREFMFKDFVEAMEFVNKVADIAQAEGHHPDIYIFYNRVKLELSTHAAKGLTENDFIMAAKIDQLS